MCTRAAPRGFTLIELVVFIVIVGTALAGVLSVFTTVTKNSADPLRQKQALAAAESLLEEILHKPFCDPDNVTLPADGSSTPAVCGTNGAEGARASFDDVDDYANYGPVNVVDVTDGSTVVTGYTLSVSVTTNGAFSVGGAPGVTATNYRIVTVTATDTLNNRSYVLTGYAFNND